MKPRILNLTLIFMTLIILLLNIKNYFEYTMDDAFIIMRYAENFAAYGKLIFNLEEQPPSEGITSPIQAIVLSIFIKFKLDPLIISKILGLILTILSGVLTFFITNTILNKISNSRASIFDVSTFSLLATCIFLRDPNTIINAVSGMETSFGTLLFLTFIYFVLFIRSSLTILLSTIIGLGASLARPEIVISIIVIYIYSMFIFEEKRKLYFIATQLFFISGMFYFIYRYSFQQLFFPLTFYLKQSTFSGLSEVYSFIKYNFIFFFFVAYLGIKLFKENKIDKRIYIFLLVIVINLIFLLTERHIMGFGFLYFQLIYPIIIILAAYGFYFFTLKIKTLKEINIYSLIIFLSLISLIYINYKKQIASNKTFISWYIPAENNVISIGKKLFNLNSGNSITIGINDCGAIPYFSKSQTIDFAGLNNRALAKNFNENTLIKEIKNNKIDLVIIRSSSDKEYKTLWNSLESYFYKYADSLGYQLVLKLKFFEGHYYWFY